MLLCVFLVAKSYSTILSHAAAVGPTQKNIKGVVLLNIFQELQTPALGEEKALYSDQFLVKRGGALGVIQGHLWEECIFLCNGGPY